MLLNGAKPQRTVLITGASTGLGLALVKELIQSGQFHVIATARSTSLSRFGEAGVHDGHANDVDIQCFKIRLGGGHRGSLV